MSDNQKQKTPLLQQVKGELEDARRKKIKGELKELIGELDKANAVVEGIMEKIEDKVREAGDKEETIKSILED